MSRRVTLFAFVVGALFTATAIDVPAAYADNRRLNSSVAANVYTVQRQAGCPRGVTLDARLSRAAQVHVLDVLNDRSLGGDVGSDGSTTQMRAEAAGYRGKVSETVAINPALAISGVEILRQWYYDPSDLAIMSDCANADIGVWSASVLDRTVVVAVYGQPS